MHGSRKLKFASSILLRRNKIRQQVLVMQPKLQIKRCHNKNSKNTAKTFDDI
jgi:hypothetical protein